MTGRDSDMDDVRSCCDGREMWGVGRRAQRAIYAGPETLNLARMGLPRPTVIILQRDQVLGNGVEMS